TMRFEDGRSVYKAPPGEWRRPLRSPVPAVVGEKDIERVDIFWQWCQGQSPQRSVGGTAGILSAVCPKHREECGRLCHSEGHRSTDSPRCSQLGERSGYTETQAVVALPHTSHPPPLPKRRPYLQG